MPIVPGFSESFSFSYFCFPLSAQVFQLMQNLTMYTENLDNNSPHDIAEIPEEDMWVLAREKRPYPKGVRFISFCGKAE